MPLLPENELSKLIVRTITSEWQYIKFELDQVLDACVPYTKSKIIYAQVWGTRMHKPNWPFSVCSWNGKQFQQIQTKKTCDRRLLLVKKMEARPHYAPATMIRSMKHCSIEQIHALCLQSKRKRNSPFLLQNDYYNQIRTIYTYSMKHINENLQYTVTKLNCRFRLKNSTSVINFGHNTYFLNETVNIMTKMT
jgi:hypothetical protein